MPSLDKRRTHLHERRPSKIARGVKATGNGIVCQKKSSWSLPACLRISQPDKVANGSMLTTGQRQIDGCREGPLAAWIHVTWRSKNPTKRSA
mmetsp:Transcript_16605/g.38279  ORF Transcript_16605/g.38279 Transcript_16605/m.38279 type:complete len:92 (+) Transcript_16605:208-483(+)